MCYLDTEQIAPNSMCSNGTETQQSAGIGNGAKGPSSMCYLDMEQIMPNSMCNNGTETEQSAGIGNGAKGPSST
eukprot:3461578-Ditylum_brightwellii.AAC.1